MRHHRYGDLDAIARKTDGRCHLCHEPVDLETHGLVRFYGREAATVDHLLPQSLGGQDDPDNLLLAHHGCNAGRGNGSARLARMRLAGTPSRPLSTEGRVGAGMSIAVAAAGLGGVVFATTDASGQKVFNDEAAFWSGLFGACVAVAALT
jgi:hypothetical protein